MPDTPSDWMVPPERDKTNIYIAVGTQAELSDEVRSSLDRLARLLGQQPELTTELRCPQVGTTNCAVLWGCTGFTTD